MGDIYVASVDFGSVAVSPALSPATVVLPNEILFDGNTVSGGFVFVAGDMLGNRFSIIIEAVRAQAVPGSPPVHWLTTMLCAFRLSTGILTDTLNPWDSWGGGDDAVSGMQFITDPTGGGFFTGGTLSITKDYSNNRVTFTSPIGSYVATLDQAGSLNVTGYAASPHNSTPLYPLGIGALGAFPQDITVAPLSAQATAVFQNFQVTKNGRVLLKHSLHNDDPGSLAVFGTEGFDGDYFDANAQLPGGLQLGYLVSPVTYESGPGDEILYTTQLPAFSSDVDMELLHEHGILCRAGPGTFQGDQMWFERSFDNGHTWALVVVADATLIGGGSLYQSPSLNWANSGLYLCWFDGSNMVESKSLDGGANWAAPVTVPAMTGSTNPRRMIDKHGGPNLLFCVEPGTGNLQVAVTYDGGTSYVGPFMVAAAVGPQQIDADWTPDGAAVVSYHEALGTWHQEKSRDAGRSWSAPTVISFAGTNPRRLIDPDGGPTLLFFITSGGDLQAALTYDGGASYLGPFTVVADVGAQQIDAEWAPDGSIVLTYSTGGFWRQKRSRDQGRSWT